MIQARGLISDNSFLKHFSLGRCFLCGVSIWVTMLCVFRVVHAKHNEGKARAICICPGNRGFQRGQLSNSCRKKLWDVTRSQKLLSYGRIRGFISHIILYIIYTSSNFLKYFTMEKFKCMQNAKTNTVYPWSTSLHNFQFMANLVIFIFQATSSPLTSKSQSHIISPAF